MSNFNQALSERMQEVLQLFGGNISEMARQSGIAPPSMKRWVDGESDPKISNLVSLANAAGVNLLWLSTGEGAKMRGTASMSSMSALSLSPAPPASVRSRSARAAVSSSATEADDNEFVFIPRYEVKTAGGKEKEKSAPAIAFRKYWVEHDLHASPDELSVIVVRGDSMAGLLNNGDVVLVNHAKNRPGDGLYVFRIGESVMVKRTQPMPNNQLWVTSVNEAYKPFSLDLTQAADGIELIGKVEWYGRQL